jgi:putative hydrolase of the HAD superfamily
LSVEAVLFDVDDTLVDHVLALETGIRAHLRDLGLPSDEEAVSRWRAGEERHFARYLSGELDLTAYRRARVADMLGPMPDDALADAWYAGYTARFEAAWSVFDDVLACLDALAVAGLRLGVVTNVELGHQRRKLAQVGILDRFAALVGLDTVGVGKPDPRPFHAACAQLGTAPGDTAYVGDHLHWDALGARDAGLVAVWLDRRGAGGAPPGLLTVRGLGEVPGVLGLGRPGLDGGPAAR